MVIMSDEKIIKGILKIESKVEQIEVYGRDGTSVNFRLADEHKEETLKRLKELFTKEETCVDITYPCAVVCLDEIGKIVKESSNFTIRDIQQQENKEDTIKVQNMDNLFKGKNGFVLGTLGKARKDKIIPIEEFDINYTPNEINIKKFVDEQGKEMVEMWYEL